MTISICRFFGRSVRLEFKSKHLQKRISPIENLNKLIASTMASRMRFDPKLMSNILDNDSARQNASLNKVARTTNFERERERSSKSLIGFFKLISWKRCRLTAKLCRSDFEPQKGTVITMPVDFYNRLPDFFLQFLTFKENSSAHPSGCSESSELKTIIKSNDNLEECGTCY